MHHANLLTRSEPKITQRRNAGTVLVQIPKNLRLGLGWSCTALFERVQLLARLEPDGLARSNADFSPGAGVAPNAGFARPHTEHAKAAQLDPLAGRQSLLEALENRIHRRFCLGARQAGTLNHLMDDVLLNHLG